MVLNRRTREAGERATRNLSNKAYSVYCNTDPCIVYRDDILFYVRSCLGDKDAISFSELDDFLSGYYVPNKDMYLWEELLKHRGHSVSIASYGDWDNPECVCLECEDCNEVILDAGIYTLCAREDA